MICLFVFLEQRLFAHGEDAFKGELDDSLELSTQISRAHQHGGRCFFRSLRIAVTRTESKIFVTLSVLIFLLILSPFLS